MIRKVYDRLSESIERIKAADEKLTKEQSDLLIDVISSTFNLNAKWKGLRKSPCLSISESLIEMINTGNLHLDNKLPWHNVNVLKILTRNHNIF